MYVRWKKQRRWPAWATPGTVIITPSKATIVVDAEGVVTYAAQLVENRRNADGKPRQHIVAHLATISECALKDDEARAAFWDAFLRKLVTVPLTKEQRETFIHAAHARVPFPLPQADEEYLRLYGQKGKSVYQMRTPAGFRTVVRSRPPRPSSSPSGGTCSADRQ